MSESKLPKRSRRNLTMSDPTTRKKSPNRLLRPHAARLRNSISGGRSGSSRARSSSVFVKPQITGNRRIGSPLRGSIDIEGILRAKITSQEKKIKKLRNLSTRLRTELNVLEFKLKRSQDKVTKEQAVSEEVRKNCKKKEEIYNNSQEVLGKLESRIIQVLYEVRTRRASVSTKGNSNVVQFFDPRYYAGKHVMVLLNELHVETRLLLSEKDHQFELLKEKFHKADQDKSLQIRKLKENIGKLKFEKNDYQFSATRALQEKSEAVDSRKVIIEESNRLMDSLRGNNESLVSEIKKGKKLIKDLNQKLLLRDEIIRNRQRQVISSTKLQKDLEKNKNEFKKKQRRVHTELVNQQDRYDRLTSDLERVKAENKHLKRKNRKLEDDSHSWKMRDVNMKVNNLKTMEEKMKRLSEQHSKEVRDLEAKRAKQSRRHRELTEKHNTLKKSYSSLMRQHRKDIRRRKMELKRVHLQRPKTSPANLDRSGEGGLNQGEGLLMASDGGEKEIIQGSGMPMVMNYRQTKEIVAAKFYKKKLREKEKECKKLEKRIKRLLHLRNMSLKGARATNIHLHSKPSQDSHISGISQKSIVFDDGGSGDVGSAKKKNGVVMYQQKRNKKKSFSVSDDMIMRNIEQKDREIKRLQQKNEELRKEIVVSSKRSRLQSL